MAVEATVVEPVDIKGGIGLVFTTMTDVAELRRRVRMIARLHAERAGTPTLIATTDDVTDGARLNIRPLDPERLEHVRVHGSARANVLDVSTCPAKLGIEALVSWIVEPDLQLGQVLTRR